MVKQDKTINNTDYVGIRYIVNNENFRMSEAILAPNLMSKLNCENNKEGLEKTEQELCDKLKLYEDADKLVDTASSCISAACNTAFKVTRGAKHVLRKTTVS